MVLLLSDRDFQGFQGIDIVAAVRDAEDPAQASTVVLASTVVSVVGIFEHVGADNSVVVFVATAVSVVALLAREHHQ